MPLLREAGLAALHFARNGEFRGKFSTRRKRKDRKRKRLLAVPRYRNLIARQIDVSRCRMPRVHARMRMRAAGEAISRVSKDDCAARIGRELPLIIGPRVRDEHYDRNVPSRMRKKTHYVYNYIYTYNLYGTRTRNFAADAARGEREGEWISASRKKMRKYATLRKSQARRERERER